MKTLIIVESPTKARTIKNYLPDVEVLASKGHVRDLATKGPFGYGVDINSFEPTYEVIKEKQGVIGKLKKEAKQKHVLLATDPDREGEAISWHLAKLLGLNLDDNNRVYFNEITKPAILEAVNNPRKINLDLVNSQESRRILDRIIGFDLSKLVQRKLHSTSAGRVQSVALKIIIDREKEIEAFIPEDYYLLFAKFDDVVFDYVKNQRRSLKDKEEAKQIISDIDKTFHIKSINTKESKRYAPYPYTTSKLQQDGIARLRVGASTVMRIAQKLYEGVNIENETVGLITYMRTDSTRLSPVFVKETYDYIEKTYTKNYVGRLRVRRSKQSQDAHEAIRPTSIKRTPESVKPYLDEKGYQLYKMIYDRTLAFLMKEGLDEVKEVTITSKNYDFVKTFTKPLFDGYRILYNYTYDPYFEQTEDNKKPLIADKVYKEDKQTEPKRRFSEPTLIEELERLGIGRPSTYAETTRRITNIGYVRRVKGYFVPTDQGRLTSDSLDEYFNSFINTQYTSKMEGELDLIASGELSKDEMLKTFYKTFKPLVEHANKHMPFQPIKKEVKFVGEACPRCGKPLVYRVNKKGEKFIACTGFTDTPKCTYTRNIEK